MKRTASMQRGNKMGRHGLSLVPRPAQLSQGLDVVREATSGRVIAMLPTVWAVAESGPEVVLEVVAELQPAQPAEAPQPELAFYRKYTEAMLRRYLRLSMEAGRVPSLLGRELFRGQVTSYRVKSFEDVVIFCHDIEKCLNQLQPIERRLIARISLQQYTHQEAAAILGISYRNCQDKYWLTLDRLTKIFLELKLMDPASAVKRVKEDQCP